MEQWHEAPEGSVSTLAVNQGIRKPTGTARKGIPSLRSPGRFLIPTYCSVKRQSLHPLDISVAVPEDGKEIDAPML
jgi:hypothetical protein